MVKLRVYEKWDTINDRRTGKWIAAIERAGKVHHIGIAKSEPSARKLLNEWLTGMRAAGLKGYEGLEA